MNAAVILRQPAPSGCPGDGQLPLSKAQGEKKRHGDALLVATEAFFLIYHMYGLGMGSLHSLCVFNSMQLEGCGGARANKAWL